MTKTTKEEIEETLTEASQRIVPANSWENAEDKQMRALLFAISEHAEALAFLVNLANE